MIKGQKTQNMFLSYETHIKEFKESVIKVGLPEKVGGAIHEGSDLTVAQIGAVHEYGSPENNIPKRSFIREPLINEEKKITNFIKSRFSAVGSNSMSAKKALEQIGNMGASISKGSFTKNNWEANSDITINGGWMIKNGKSFFVKGKKKSTPLIDSGQLRNSITYVVEKS